MFDFDGVTGRANIPFIDETGGGHEPQSVEACQQLSDLLDKTIDTRDGDAHKLELRRVIEHAARSGGTLDLSRTGASLSDLPPDVMTYLDQAFAKPITSVILPPGLEALPPCICQLQRLACVELDAPEGTRFDFRPLKDLIRIDLTNVPKQARMEVLTLVHCNLTATWPDGHLVTGEQHTVSGEYVIHLTDVRDAKWVRRRLSDLLDCVIDAHGPSKEAKKLRRAIERAARDGNILNLSQAGSMLSKLPQEVMLFLEEACEHLAKPLEELILPSGIEWLPPCVFQLRHLLHVRANRPGSADLNFADFPALCKITLENVPWNTRVRFDAPLGCEIVAIHPNHRPARVKQGHLQGKFKSCEIAPRVPNYNHAASFQNGKEVECRHIALNVIGSWGFQDTLPLATRDMYKPLLRVSTPSSISLTTPWEIDAIHAELCERPVESYYVSLKNWPQFQRAMLHSLAEHGASKKYMLVLSLRHDTSIRLTAGGLGDEGTIEHYDPNYTTTSTHHAVPCNFIDMFADVPYFDVIYATSKDVKVPPAQFARVIIIPNPLDLRSGVASRAKDVKLSLEFADFDEIVCPALVAHLCQYRHSFFFPQLADHIKTNSLLTRERCMDVLQATVFVDCSLMYRAANEDDDGVILGLGQCIEVGFAKGILTADDVFNLVAAKHGAEGAWSIAIRKGHVAAIEAYGRMLHMLFDAKALSRSQVTRLMIGGGKLNIGNPVVRKAYKAVLARLLDKGVLTKDNERAIRERIFDDD